VSHGLVQRLVTGANWPIDHDADGAILPFLGRKLRMKRMFHLCQHRIELVDLC
jgi:hypothetical protein